MEILTYEEIDDDQLSELTLACFDHAYSREHISNMVEADSRLPQWGGELYAMEGGKVLGTVGLLYPRLKTKTGIVKVGGIRNVCTRPSASRKGVARKLMEKAHGIMVEEGVPFSFLMTSSSLVGYKLYRKLGYKDIHVYPTAFKKLRPKTTEVEFRGDPDPSDLLSQYSKSVDGLTGLVVREDEYWRMAEARGWPDNDTVNIACREGDVIGYAMYRKRRKQLDCGEIAAKDEETLTAIINALEAAADREYIVFYLVNPNHYSLLKKLGYTISTDNWGRVMVKELLDQTLEHDSRFHVGIYETF